jgi:hypothetical protein
MTCVRGGILLFRIRLLIKTENVTYIYVLMRYKNISSGINWEESQFF